MSAGPAVLHPDQGTASEPPQINFATLVGPSFPQPRRASTGESTLLAMVAHELRTPLTSLRLSLDVLVDEFDQLDRENAMRLIQRVQRSACWLQALTDNLTSAAAVEAGHLEVRTASVHLTECISDAILLVHGLLEQRRQRVQVFSSSAADLVKADRARVTQVIANLLTNASRYSVDGDQIEVHVSALGHQLRVRVTDHGPGVAPEDQHRIFGAWTRADGAAPGGLGLGLSIVQNLIQQQGGRVGVDSKLGQGATFWFTLPVD